MNQQFTVLLYSQYSPKCKRLLDTINSCPIDLGTIAGLSPVCIDNEDVRARIIGSSQIDVQVVPCILIVHPDGGIEKYDGGNAFKWVEEITQKFTPPPPPPQQTSRVLSATTPRPPPMQLEEDIQPYYPPKKPNHKPRRPSSAKQRPPTNAPLSKQHPATSVDDLDDDDDDDDDYVPPRPPASMIIDSGNTIQTEFGQVEESNRLVHKGIRDSTQPARGGKVDILATAQAMQKDRDMDFEKQRPVGLPAGR